MTRHHAVLAPEGNVWNVTRYLDDFPMATFTGPMKRPVVEADRWLAFQGFRAIHWMSTFDTAYTTDLKAL
jgi:hypothetical protein